jgi:hypothetical protein
LLHGILEAASMSDSEESRREANSRSIDYADTCIGTPHRSLLGQRSGPTDQTHGFATSKSPLRGSREALDRRRLDDREVCDDAASCEQPDDQRRPASDVAGDERNSTALPRWNSVMVGAELNKTIKLPFVLLGQAKASRCSCKK